MSSGYINRGRAEKSSAAQTDLPVLKPFTYNAGGQADNLLFSHWLADFSPRSLALFAAIVLLWPSIVLAQSNYSFGQAMEALWRWLPFIVGQGFVLNLLVSVVTMLVGTIAGVLLGLGQISPIKVISIPSWFITQLFRNSPWLVLLFIVMLALLGEKLVRRVRIDEVGEGYILEPHLSFHCI